MEPKSYYLTFYKTNAKVENQLLIKPAEKNTNTTPVYQMNIKKSNKDIDSKLLIEKIMSLKSFECDLVVDQEALKKYINKTRETISHIESLFNDSILDRVSIANAEKVKNLRLIFKTYTQNRKVCEILSFEDGEYKQYNKSNYFWKIIIGGLTAINIDFQLKRAFFEFSENFYELISEWAEIKSMEVQESKDEAKNSRVHLQIVAVNKIRNTYLQGNLRKQILKEHRSCRFCEIDLEDMLIISHIIPFKICVDKKELNKKAFDVNNAFLLCANHDKLFDKEYVTLTREGKIITTHKEQNINRYASDILGKFIKINKDEQENVSIRNELVLDNN